MLALYPSPTLTPHPVEEISDQIQNATFMYPHAPWRDISQEGKTVCWLFTPPPPWSLTLLKRFLTRYRMLHSCTHPPLGGISHRKVRQYVGSLLLTFPPPSSPGFKLSHHSREKWLLCPGKLGRSGSQIGKNYGIFCQFKRILAITHTIAIKGKEK